jgi:triosephosphate isomerase
MPPIIAANFKMNFCTASIPAYIAALANAPSHVTLIICPPFSLLDRFAQSLPSTAALGGQDCHAQPAGAHTGDISAPMLKDIGATYVILGHSERRENHGETNADVNAKIQAAMKAGLIPIVCVGEQKTERQAGIATDIVHSQLIHSLPANFTGIVAYEPIWAIGTGLIPSDADITAMHAAIRATITAHLPANGPTTPILYGGSVKPSNAATILALPQVGGALVGGASLNAADLLAIAANAPAV